MSCKVGNQTNSQDPQAVNSRVFVGNLNTFQCSKTDVERMFQRYGRIAGISMHKGYAFIQFTNPFDARSACLGEDGRLLWGQTLDTNMVAEPKPHQTGRKRQNMAKTGNDWDYYYDSYYAQVGFPASRLVPPLKRARLHVPPPVTAGRPLVKPPSPNKMSPSACFSASGAASFSDLKSYSTPDILICGNCRELFTEIEQLMEHKKTYCKLRFTCKCHMLNGCKPKTPGEEPASLLCSQCKDSFHSAWDLMVHVQAAHMLNIYQLSSPENMSGGCGAGANASATNGSLAGNGMARDSNIYVGQECNKEDVAVASEPSLALTIGNGNNDGLVEDGGGGALVPIGHFHPQQQQQQQQQQLQHSFTQQMAAASGGGGCSQHLQQSNIQSHMAPQQHAFLQLIQHQQHQQQHHHQQHQLQLQQHHQVIQPTNASSSLSPSSISTGTSTTSPTCTATSMMTSTSGGGDGQGTTGILSAPQTGCCSAAPPPAAAGDNPAMTNCLNDMLLAERRGTPERQMNGSLATHGSLVVGNGGCVHNNNNNNNNSTAAAAPATPATTMASASTSTFPMEASTQTHNNLLMETGGGSNFEEHCSLVAAIKSEASGAQLGAVTSGQPAGI